MAYWYLDFLNENPGMQGRRRAAFLTGHPNEVVITMLFSTIVEHKEIFANVISTVDSAVRWVKKQMSQSLPFNRDWYIESSRGYPQRPGNGYARITELVVKGRMKSTAQWQR